jgi:23S rRNA pseudouridine1911/1915/1917 synthase
MSDFESRTLSMAATVTDELAGQRLDQVASRLFPDYSRSRLQAWIKSGALTVDGAIRRTSDRLEGGEALALNAVIEPQVRDAAQAITLDIVHEDDALIVINKPADLVVHPAAGHSDGTLLNALLHHCPQVAELPRAGIVHRLDKDTTGLMVVAKTLEAHTDLVAQLQDRSVSRRYLAVVQGAMVAGGTVNAPIGRHPTDRQRQAVLTHGGKDAITHYRVKTRFRDHTLVACQLETGRTHQIRVHMAHIRHPLIGDATYGGRLKLPKGASDELIDMLRNFRRQALHAEALGLYHPDSGEYCEWQVSIPADFEAMLAVLARNEIEDDR